MRLGPGPSWQMSISDPFDLFFALYVRGTAGIGGADDVPSLTPPVPGWSSTYSETQQAAFAEQWRTWWTALLTDGRDDRGRGGIDGPDFPSTVDAHELRQAQQAVFRPAYEWRNANRFDDRHSDYEASMMPTYLVAEIEKEAGRKAPPFAYAVEVVPVDGRWLRDLSLTRVMLSENLYADTAAFREALRPRLTALMDD